MQTEPAWRKSWVKRAQAAAIAAIGWPIIEALSATWTYRVSGLEHLRAIDAAGHVPILAFWHGRVLAGLPYFRNRGIIVITSQNFDGEWIARIIAKFGYGAARGSSSRGGAKALVHLRQALKAGHPVAFTLDGPRGPARVAQPGAVWLAGATGHPVLPFHVEADESRALRSWDGHQIPKAGTTIRVAIGAPVYVANTDEATVEAARKQVEKRLSDLALSLNPQSVNPQSVNPQSANPQSVNPNPPSSILNPQ